MGVMTYASCRNAAFCRRKHPKQTRVTWLFWKCNKVQEWYCIEAKFLHLCVKLKMNVIGIIREILQLQNYFSNIIKVILSIVRR